MSDGKEIEVRFREVDVASITERLKGIGFTDGGDDLFREVIFYDGELTWIGERKVRTRFIRVRSTKAGVVVTYKSQRQDVQTAEAEEHEFTVDSFEAAVNLFTALGYCPFREQEKRRHTWHRGNLRAEFDTWPKIPTFLELEAQDEGQLKALAAELGFSWDQVTWENAGNLIEKYYGLQVSTMSKYTFDEIIYQP